MLVLRVRPKKAIPSGVAFFRLALVTIWSQVSVVKMIDWVTAIIPCQHPEKVFGGNVSSITPEGEIEWRVEKKQQVPGTHEANFSVKSLDDKTLYLDGNPSKWLQGHNLFGSDNLMGLVEAVLHRLTPLLKLTPTESDLAAWWSGNYELKRVDCTAMWNLPRRADVRSWLRAAEHQAKSRHGRPIMRGGTLYFGQNSRRWTIKFYSKGDELEASGKGHKLPSNIHEYDNLKLWADSKLRGELTLRSMQLKDKGLNLASKWTEETPLDMLITYIEGLDMAEQFSLTPAVLEGLPGRLMAVYFLWQEGKDLRAMYPKATFYRYRSELLKHGIDVAIRQPSKPDNIIPLVRVLRPEAVAQIPKWAVDTSLCFNAKG
jgi:II/X family phage/plasmid replication protein